MEGDVIGLLCMDRHRVEPFDEEDLHRAKAVAFSAAAAIRKAQLLEQVQRYAALMERVAEVDQAVFAGNTRQQVASLILEGARRMGNYPGGLFASAAGSKKVIAAFGVLERARGKAAPRSMMAANAMRLDAVASARVGRALGVKGLGQGLYLVPLSDGDSHLGTLALIDPDGPGPDDRLVEAYGSRAASAWLHAIRAARMSAHPRPRAVAIALLAGGRARRLALLDGRPRGSLRDRRREGGARLGAGHRERDGPHP